MQTVAQGWLVLQLTNSAFSVGLVSTLGTLPILFFTLYGGVLADRVNRRRWLVVLQSLMLVEALFLAILTGLHLVSLPWVMILALLFGTLSAFEVPIRQAFLIEMVGRDDIMNAIALNSSVFNVARILGPVIAGTLIASLGLAACFYTNAASYFAVLTGLLMMRFPVGGPAGGKTGESGAFADGVRYALGQPGPRSLLTLIAVFSVFGHSFIAMLPVFARQDLGTGAAGYGGLMSAVGIGAASGAIGIAAFGRRVQGGGLIRVAGMVFGLSLIATAFARGYVLALLLVAVAGFSMFINLILTNSRLQTGVPDRLRGRVMGFYSWVVLGMAPFGSILAGWVSEHFGVPTTLAVGGAICALTAALMRRGPMTVNSE